MTTEKGIRRAAERATRGLVLFIEVVPIGEAFPGEGIWGGGVSVFETPRTDRVYAWAVEGTMEPQFVAVLHRTPVDSPLSAVRAWLASQVRRRG